MLKSFLRIYNRFFSSEKEFAEKLRPLIGFTPANLSIFKLAFSHKSNPSDKAYAMQNNERLEYLGDAVLGTIVAEYLFKKYPNANEGFLTKMRSKIVKRSTLNSIGDKMGLDVLLQEYSQTRLSRSMLGNAVEALVGAVYIERGYDGTTRFVVGKMLRNYVNIHELESYDDNYKSQLLEWCQKNGQTVSYKLVARYKFEKRDRFKVAVMVDGNKIATADDFNKKSAEQTASEKAMLQLGIMPEGHEKGSNKKKEKKKSDYAPVYGDDGDMDEEEG
ncbi:MAG: ribonuclease III [Saprospiraceae bacterium]